MPIKLPKTFARRKSSGNALEEIDDPPPGQSSFRVLPRGDDGQSFAHARTASDRINNSHHQRWPDGSFDDGQQHSNRYGDMLLAGRVSLMETQDKQDQFYGQCILFRSLQLPINRTILNRVKITRTSGIPQSQAINTPISARSARRRGGFII